MKKFVRYILELLFPPRCAVCGEIIPMNSAICSDCADELVTKLYGRPLCSRCGKPLDSCVCHDDTHYAKAISAFEYNAKTKTLFHRLKTDKYSPAAAQLAEIMVSCFLNSELSRITPDCITYVPSGAEKAAAKGFDHAQILAERFAARLSVPCIAPPIVQTDVYCTQHGLSSSQRITNVELGYTASLETSVSGRVLIVDDIMTTGATLDRCAALLIERGASQVFCITAATTLLQKDREKV